MTGGQGLERERRAAGRYTSGTRPAPRGIRPRSGPVTHRARSQGTYAEGACRVLRACLQHAAGFEFSLPNPLGVLSNGRIRTCVRTWGVEPRACAALPDAKHRSAAEHTTDTHRKADAKKEDRRPQKTTLPASMCAAVEENTVSFALQVHFTARRRHNHGKKAANSSELAAFYS